MTYLLPLTSAELADLKAAAKADLADDFTHQEIPVAIILRLIDMIERRHAWQPIETAPRDGAHVLVAHGEIVGEARFYAEDGQAHEGWYWNDQHWTDAAGGEPFHPTHWQPLPAPPSEVIAALKQRQKTSAKPAARSSGA